MSDNWARGVVITLIFIVASLTAAYISAAVIRYNADQDGALEASGYWDQIQRGDDIK